MKRQTTTIALAHTDTRRRDKTIPADRAQMIDWRPTMGKRDRPPRVRCPGSVDTGDDDRPRPNRRVDPRPDNRILAAQPFHAPRDTTAGRRRGGAADDDVVWACVRRQPQLLITDITLRARGTFRITDVRASAYTAVG